MHLDTPAEPIAIATISRKAAILSDLHLPGHCEKSNLTPRIQGSHLNNHVRSPFRVSFGTSRHNGQNGHATVLGQSRDKLKFQAIWKARDVQARWPHHGILDQDALHYSLVRAARAVRIALKKSS